MGRYTVAVVFEFESYGDAAPAQLEEHVCGALRGVGLGWALQSIDIAQVEADPTPPLAPAGITVDTAPWGDDSA